MAIDTREKRQSVAWLIPVSAPSVTPNASKDQEWRQQAGWGYMGILADEPALAIIEARTTVLAYFEPNGAYGHFEPSLDIIKG